MQPILNMGGPRLEVNALFLQPTRWCALNCKGCYVKEHSGGEEDYHTPWLEQAKLIGKFMLGQEAWANQITISMDDPPRPGNDSIAMFGHISEETKRYSHMINLAGSVVEAIADLSRRKQVRPEMHATFHAPETFATYNANVDLSMGFFDMVSFSDLRLRDIAWLKTQFTKATHVNWNLMIPQNITSFNLEKHLDKVTRIGEVVDSIYLIMFKNPIGAERNELVQVGDRHRMISDIAYINTLLDRLPPDVRAKVNVDGCLKDTMAYTRTGFGCSSNVSRFQVWPNGSVSGCPYAIDGNTPIGRRAEDIMDNIRKARAQYDFTERCHLPQVYNSISG